MTTLILATGNAHKVQEIQAMLSSRYRFFTLRDFPGAPTAVEDAETFAGNAVKKAAELARWIADSEAARLFREGQGRGEVFVVADDSGLEVDALGGQPGVYSARFAALGTDQPGNSSDQANNAKLMGLLADVPAEKRTARFRCALALSPAPLNHARAASPVCYLDDADLRTEVFEGSCEGRIAMQGQGRAGFGYDPLFIPAGFERSFAELGEEIKNQMSHRARALEKLRAWLEGRGL